MDLEKFRRAKLERPTAVVELPELADFFADGEKPVFLVRGLTSNENWLAREQKALYSHIKTFEDAFNKALGGQPKELQAEAVKSGRPELLFRTSVQGFATLDGKRFLVQEPVGGEQKALPMAVVTNWAAGLGQ